MHRFRRPSPVGFKGSSRVAGIGLALALTAAACGAEVAPTIEAASDTGSADPDADSAEPGVEGPVAPGSAEAAESGSTAPAEEPTAAAPSSNHVFPDLDTLNVVDGSTVNLAAELAGGDTPILLWFWAPH